jgi:hypothetical protein
MNCMTTAAFNPLDFADKLKAAGVPQAQAEAQARAMVDVLSNVRDDLATKADVREVSSEIRELRAEFNGKFTLLQWMLGSLIALALAIALKLFL